MSDLVCPVLDFNMSVPRPIKLTAVAASLCVLKVAFFPQLYASTNISTLFITTTAIIFGLWCFWKVFIYPSWASPFRHLPTPPGAYPLLGFPKISFRQPCHDVFLKFVSEVPNEGLLRFPVLFNQHSLFLTDPSSLQEVLSQKTYDFEKPKDLRDFLRLILGNGLVVVEGDEHKFQRKHLTPAFHFRHIKELYPLFWSKSVDLVGRIKAEIHANPEPTKDPKHNHLEGIVEINSWANKATMDIIGVGGLGRDFNTLYNSDDELIASYEEILEPTKEKIIFFGMNIIFPQRLIAALPWKLNERLKETTNSLRRTCRQLVQDKKQSIANEKDHDIDILSILIKSNNFADDMLVDQLLTFLAAGHETTSSSFTWATHVLATHPEAQARLRKEVRDNIPSLSAAKDPSFDLAGTLENLPFLSAVCNELLRLYPSVPTTIRIAVRDTSIQGTFIPAGTRIWLSPWAINRSPLLWGSNSQDFAPERWLDPKTGKANNNGGVSSNYANLTFLHGPRSCIGEKFARSEFRALVAAFVGTFHLEMADPNEVPVVAGAITTKPRDGMRLRLRVLEGWSK